MPANDYFLYIFFFSVRCKDILALKLIEVTHFQFKRRRDEYKELFAIID